jgi:hypothetical protein
MTAFKRVAYSLDVLLAQIDAKWPNRSKASDGALGDIRHQQEHSDHNPNVAGIVCARDFTNDPAHGLVSRDLAQALIEDVRIQYVISNRQICTGKHADGPSPGVWRAYTGVNPHEHHCHVSVKQVASAYDNKTPWNLDGVGTQPQLVTPLTVGTALWLQQQLNKHGAKLQEDGHEGALTIAATRAFAVDQLKKG